MPAITEFMVEDAAIQMLEESPDNGLGFVKVWAIVRDWHGKPTWMDGQFVDGVTVRTASGIALFDTLQEALDWFRSERLIRQVFP